MTDLCTTCGGRAAGIDACQRCEGRGFIADSSAPEPVANMKSGDSPNTDELFYIVHELKATFAEIEKGETMNQRRSTSWEDTPGKRFFKQYVPRPMTITDAKQIAHHAVLKIDRWLKEHPDV